MKEGFLCLITFLIIHREWRKEGENMVDEVMTIPEVAEYLKVTRQTVHRLMKDGKIKAFKIGRSTRILKSELDKFIEERMKAERVDFEKSVFRKYLDEESTEEVSLKEALVKLMPNYPKLSEKEIIKMLEEGTLITPGAIYSFNKKMI